MEYRDDASMLLDRLSSPCFNCLMHRFSFDRGSLGRSIRSGDASAFGVNLDTGRDAILDAAVAQALNINGSPPAHTIVKVRGKDCVYYTEYTTHLIHRTIADYLARRFRVRPLSRDQIIRGTLESLTDTTPMWIVRRDVKSFYETVPTSEIQTRLLYDTALPTSIRAHLGHLFASHCPSAKGLPRGVGLATVLSELAMNGFDANIRSIEGVYRYFRYSDDILVFSYLEPSELCKKLKYHVETMGMTFNEQKSYERPVSQPKGGKNSKLVTFEYLGYGFRFNDLCFREKPREINVFIADSKIVRMKSRILACFRDFKRTSDVSLLSDRIKYLSSNYVILNRSKTNAIRSHIKTGVYYNYHMCGSYSKSGKSTYDCVELKNVDGFYQSLLRGSGSEFAAQLAAKSNAVQLRQLRELSFFKGYEKRVVVRFPRRRLKVMQGVWKGV